MYPLTAHIGTYTNLRIRTTYYNNYLLQYFYFTLIIKSYCSIVPYKMTTIPDQYYHILDPTLVFSFSLRMDCFFGTTYTVTLNNGHSLYSFITFTSAFQQFKVYAN